MIPAQKQRLDAAIASGQRTARTSKEDLAKLCSSQAGFTNVPVVETVEPGLAHGVGLPDLLNAYLLGHDPLSQENVHPRFGYRMNAFCSVCLQPVPLRPLQMLRPFLLEIVQRGP